MSEDRAIHERTASRRMHVRAGAVRGARAARLDRLLSLRLLPAGDRRSAGGGVGFERSRVTLSGPISRFTSSPGVSRGFCAGCGTSISYENVRWPGDIHLMMGAFDAPERLAPAFHIFAGEHLPWLRLADDLPRYRTTPSAGELV